MFSDTKSHWGGGIVTVALSFLFIGLFWGFSWFTNWKTNVFSSGSDDLTKDLYTTTWHVAYDDNMATCNAMNYPHGEYYTFTGLHPIIAAPLQMLHKMGVLHTERAVLPLMNLWTFLSIVLCALFLYLVFVELKLPVWYAVIVALLITLMSPQLQRMGGHLSLSYYCVIPMLIYFVLRHLRTLHWGWAAAIGFFGILFGLCHPYYFVFYIFLAICETVYLIAKQNGTNDRRANIITILLYVFLAVIIPTALFYLFTHLGMPDGNRTAVPSGFHQYRGRIEGILFPYGRLYFLEHSRLFADITWEARSYVGAVSVVAILLVVWNFIKNITKGRLHRSLSPTNSPRLNFILLCATVLMLLACGLPLAWFPRNIVSYIGPFAQFRAQARFVWLFYYVINIVAFYGLFRWWMSASGKIRNAVMLLALFAMAAEATAYNWRNKAWYSYNTIPQWTDYDNLLPQNQWINDFDASKYQAILTLPIFNAGSESFYVGSRDNMFQKSCILSLKTGLPLVCNESARSDINQAWNCIALGRTAWDSLYLPNQMTDSRPLLLAVSPDSTQLSSAEMLIVAHASPIIQIEGVNLYSLSLDEFPKIVAKTKESLLEKADSCKKSPFEQPNSSSIQQFNSSMLTSDIHNTVVLYDGAYSLKGEVEISFWMSNILDDMYSRCHLKVFATDNDGNTSQIFGWGAFELIDIVDIPHNEGLYRLRLTPPDNTATLHIEMRNKEMRPSIVNFHHLLIRLVDTDVLADGDKHYLNNIPLSLISQ